MTSKANNIKNYYKKKWSEVAPNPLSRAYWARCKDRRFKAYYKPPYTKEELKTKMESYFTFGGFSWENYGEWEVDHIIPLVQGGLDEIENLQPLWKRDNRKKPYR